MKRKILSWFNIDLDKYNNLKSENKKLKEKISNLDKEINLYYKDLKLECKHKDELKDHFPPNTNITIDEAYNKGSNTERLIYKQKLERLIELTKN